MRRKRHLTEKELDLWKKVNVDTIKLAFIEPEINITSESSDLDEHPALNVLSEKPVGKTKSAAFNLKTGLAQIKRAEIETLAPVAAGLDRKTSDRLRKGKTPPQARLDLHGMTTQRAYSALMSFINRTYDQNLRCVLIITGKGSVQDKYAPFQMEGGRGVLRANVPKWLMQPDVSSKIVGVYQANQKHGGDGAYYVYLKKKR